MCDHSKLWRSAQSEVLSAINHNTIKVNDIDQHIHVDIKTSKEIKKDLLEETI